MYGAINWVLALLGLAVVYVSFSGTFQSSTQAAAPSQGRAQNALVTTHEQLKTNLTPPQEQPKTAVPAALVPTPLNERDRKSMPVIAAKAPIVAATTKTTTERSTTANEPEQIKEVPFRGAQHLHPPNPVPSAPSAFPEGF